MKQLLTFIIALVFCPAAFALPTLDNKVQAAEEFIRVAGCYGSALYCFRQQERIQNNLVPPVRNPMDIPLSEHYQNLPPLPNDPGPAPLSPPQPRSSYDAYGEYRQNNPIVVPDMSAMLPPTPLPEIQWLPSPYGN